MKLKLEKASRKKNALKMVLYGVSGMGKTYTALSLADYMSDGKFAVIDSENRSSEKYQGSKNDGMFEFDIVSLGNPEEPDDVSYYSSQDYIDALQIVREAGIEWVVVDSLSHAWASALAEIERIKPKYRNNSYAAWGEVTPRFNKLMRYITNSPLNIIATLRAKDEYEQSKDENGKPKITKLGLEPIFRKQFEYEFDIVGQMEEGSNLIIRKSRCFELSNRVFPQPKGQELGKILQPWLGEGISEEEQNKKVYINRIQDLIGDLNAAEIQHDYSKIDLETLNAQELLALGKELAAKVKDL